MFVCLSDYGKNTGTILMKLARGVYGPKKNPVHFGANPNQQIIFLFVVNIGHLALADVWVTLYIKVLVISVR